MASNNRESLLPPKTLLVSWLARLYKHKLTTTTGGNLSLIDDDGNMYITPSGGDKAFVPPEHVAVLPKKKKRYKRLQKHSYGSRGKNKEMDVSVNDFEGPKKPSIEWPLHTAVYKVRPGCRAVLHAHSMTLVAFSLANKNDTRLTTMTMRGKMATGANLEREQQQQQQQRMEHHHSERLGEEERRSNSSLTNGSIPFGAGMMMRCGMTNGYDDYSNNDDGKNTNDDYNDDDDQNQLCNTPPTENTNSNTTNNNNNNKEEYDVRTPDTRCLLSAYQSCGNVVFAPYAIPGSNELADVCASTLEKNPNATCIILQNHGVMTIGRSLHEAYDRFVALEYLARSIVNALPLGVCPRPLPERVLRVVRNGELARSALALSVGNYADSFNNNDDDNEEEEVDRDELFPRSIPQCAAAGCCCRRNRIVTGIEKQARANLCKFVHRAYAQNLITSSSGSFSVRLTDEEGGENNNSPCTDELSFLITPTKVDRKDLEPSDVCFVSNDKYCRHDEKCTGTSSSSSSSLLSASSKRRRIDLSYSLRYHPIHHPQSPERVSPSRAASVHATIYAEHPEIMCIMVVQPPFATSFCVTGEPFDSSGIPEALIVLGDVKKVPLESVMADRGKEVARIIDPERGINTVLITGYGLLTVGTGGATSGCLLKTFVQLECCENMCGVYLTAKNRGAPHLLTADQVRDINDTFNQGH